MFVKKIKYSGIRSTVGEYIHLGSRINPIFITAEISAGRLKEYCSGNQLSYTPVLMKIIAGIRVKYPVMNTVLARDFLRRKIYFPDDVDMAVAIEKTENGETFITSPVIRQVDRKSVPELTAEIKMLAETPFGERIDAKSIWLFNVLPSFMKYIVFCFICQSQYLFRKIFGTIGFTNLGSFGVMNMYPHWINTVVFGIGCIEEKPVVQDGAIVIVPVLHVTMAFNHRIFDGAMAARILAEFKRVIVSGEFDSV
jgi:pyruvate/2-oxoglutarate dehydrogenase complex dihydrolipoamide acyltransferase (E2) component